MGYRSRALRAPQLTAPAALPSVLVLLLLWGLSGSVRADDRGDRSDLLRLLSGPAARTGIRVLIYRGRGPLRVRSMGTGPVRLRADGGQLRVDGRETPSPWESPDARFHDVAGRRVRGSLRAYPTEDGFALVNHLDLEDYLKGTLGREMVSSWSGEALRAQAVASRTYAIRHADPSSRWDLGADTQYQVYGGVADETASVRAAVEATRGEVLIYAAQPILAAFHSASGGRTASAEEVWGEALPYLVSVPVPNEEDSPDTYWRAAVSAPTLGRALAAGGWAIGDPLEIEVVNRSPSGRVLGLELRGTLGRAKLTGRELRSLLGESTLKSTLFEVRARSEPGAKNNGSTQGWAFVGSGRGHGVGMSQWGARAMAQNGTSYRDILGAFYPGARIARLPLAEREARANAGGPPR